MTTRPTSLSIALVLAATATAHADVESDLRVRFADDPQAAALAVALHSDTGDVATAGSEEVMDGGYRGKIHLLPQLPLHRDRQHLAWVVAAAADFDAFFAAVFAGQPRPAYRWRDIELRFVRSVGVHTPSAYATGWTVTYNVRGSLVTSATSVRELLFHELFHSNDAAHQDWSARVLAPDYASIIARCGQRVACLAPYAPTSLRVRGGTFYAFQPHNGDTVREYAAELAVRYFDEQREMLAHGQLAARAFKCGPAENQRAWHALVAEFFAGRDLVPSCALP